MSAGSQNITGRELIHQRIARVRRVLLDQWDPLYVGDNRKLADEYDGYLGEIVKALDEPVSVEQLARLLADIEDGWFDEAYQKERWEVCLATAHVLLEPPSE
jgi:regulator of sirC expression with transglutaminase-like and TPR domain